MRGEAGISVGERRKRDAVCVCVEDGSGVCVCVGEGNGEEMSCCNYDASKLTQFNLTSALHPA